MKVRQLNERTPLSYWDDDELGRSTPDNDQFTKRKMQDTRKPSLTLKRLNKLKKIRATKRLEQLKREDLLPLMYGGAASGGDDEGGMGL